MNINSPNFLTLLSGAGDSKDFSSALNVQGIEVDDFAQALLAEIGQLQDAEGALGIQSIGSLSEPSLQEIAALLGNKLPVAAKLDQDINLNETLAALKEVLQYITAATSSSELTPMAAHSQPFDPEEKRGDEGDDEQSLAGLLQTMSENQDDPVYAELLSGTIEELSGSLGRQESGGVQAEAERNSYPPLQSLIQNSQSVVEDKASSGEEKITVAPISDVVKIPEVPVAETGNRAPQKSEIFEQPLADMDIDKGLVKMTGDVIQWSKRGAVEPKQEIPVMTRSLTHPGWGQELGDRILWMNNKAVPFAELRLNPQHLGPVSIRIDMDQDQARITFSAQQASVREAIEAAVPKLREMLGGQQIHLAEVNVSQSPTFDQNKSPGFGQMAQQQQSGGGQKKEDESGVFDHNSHLADIVEATDGD